MLHFFLSCDLDEDGDGDEAICDKKPAGREIIRRRVMVPFGEVVGLCHVD
jgi:hypothetical protein